MFDLINSLQAYSAFNTQEETYRSQSLNLLEQKGLFAFDNNHFTPGHITGSAFVLNKADTKVLLVQHSVLNKWFQPGGHSDGSPDTFSVALRELVEETGILHSDITWEDDDIFDIDIHAIPESKGRPQHYHYDIRFLFRVGETVRLNASAIETSDIKWLLLTNVRQYNQSSGMMRMLDKCKIHK